MSVKGVKIMRNFKKPIVFILSLVIMYTVCMSAFAANPLYGDATNNGSVDIIDLIRVKKHILYGDELEVYLVDCDLTGDIDAVDLIQLRKYLLDSKNNKYFANLSGEHLGVVDDASDIDTSVNW